MRIETVDLRIGGARMRISRPTACPQADPTGSSAGWISLYPLKYQALPAPCSMSDQSWHASCDMQRRIALRTEREKDTIHAEAGAQSD